MDKLEDCVIYILNPLRAKKLFGENVDEDILKNEFTRKVVEENIKYFTTIDRELLKEFFQKTGIVLAHKIKDKKTLEDFYFTMHGYRVKNSDKWYENVQDEHILICHEKPEEIDTTGSKEVEFSDDIFNLNYALTVETLTEPRENRLSAQINVLTMGRSDEKFKLEGLKQIMQNTFGEIFLLYEDGVLLRDGEKYAEDVEMLVRLGSGTKYIVYKNNSVETIESYYIPSGFRDGFTKIVASDENGFIALLKKGELEVMTTSEKSEGYATHYFSGVDDIDFKENLEFDDEGYGDLLIKSGDATIKMKFEAYDSPWFVGI